MLAQRTYPIDPIVINGTRVSQVIIDPHYEERHSGSINDSLILQLIKKLDGRQELPESINGKYSYFATLIELSSKQYRLIWLIEKDAIYVGVVNAYRDERGK